MFVAATKSTYGCSRPHLSIAHGSRRREATLGGVKIFLPAPEDVILAKLEWARLAGGSEKQVGDAAGVYEVQADVLDKAYLNEWVTRLELGSFWADMLRKAAP